MKAAATLENDHRELNVLLDQAFSAIDKGNIGVLHALLDRFWARLAVHIRAEHKRVFPSLLAANDFGGVIDEEVLETLRTDHDFFMKELASLVSEAGNKAEMNPSTIRERLAVVADRLTSHNEIEESSVYPAVATLLSPSVAAELERNIEAELNNMPRRFAQGP